MKWKYVVATTESNIEKVEKELGYSFPNDFRECVLKNNSGTPENYIFNLSDGTQKVFGGLLSFNEEDEDYIIKFNKSDNNMEFVKVALDPFGNEIAYEKATNEIVFINHETNEVSRIATNWQSFEEALLNQKELNKDE